MRSTVGYPTPTGTRMTLRPRKRSTTTYTPEVIEISDDS